MKSPIKWEDRHKTKEPSIYIPEENVLIPAITLLRGKWKGASFFMGFQDGFVEIAKKKLGAEAMKVFLFLLGHIEYENLLVISQVEIARELEMKKQNVSRAIKTLITENVLEIKDPHRKRRQRFRLNLKYAWKGSLKNLPKEQKNSAKKPRTSSNLKKGRLTGKKEDSQTSTAQVNELVQSEALPQRAADTPEPISEVLPTSVKNQ